MPTERKPFLLRLDPKVLSALQRWAEDDLRSAQLRLRPWHRERLLELGDRIVELGAQD